MTEFIIVFFSWFSIFSGTGENDKWTSYYEDEKVQISYQFSDCLDQSNSSQLGFYFLKIENKTTDQINIQYEVGDKNTSYKKSVYGKQIITYNVVLAAKEIQIGECSSIKEDLKIYVKNIKQDGTIPIVDFQLSNIKIFKN
ncbi:MAG: hypothetical protein COB60_12595 [Flavobacteriaceae bacterium]|nr:MAG: hypothetical protein COB60_12595 [Flavobacteriaceae bacterium]